MAFKQVAAVDADTTTAVGGVNRKTGKKNPTSVEGYYIGSKQVDSPKAKSGKAYLYILQTPKGNLGVWGKTDMDKKMQQVTPGNMIRITHSGMQATPNGEMYKYTVEQDDTNVIEVAASNVPEQADDSEPSFDQEESFDAATPNDLDEEDDRQAQALAQAERKAKVQAMLNKNKRA